MSTIYRMSPDNRIVIVDEEEYDKNIKLANLNKKEIEELATEKFLAYVKENGISMNFSLNNVAGRFKEKVITEINYDRRGWPESVSETIKHTIVNDITNYVNDHFKHYKEDCDAYIKEMWDYQLDKQIKKLKFWKKLSYTFIVLTSLLLIAFCF